MLHRTESWTHQKKFLGSYSQKWKIFELFRIWLHPDCQRLSWFEKCIQSHLCNIDLFIFKILVKLNKNTITAAFSNIIMWLKVESPRFFLLLTRSPNNPTKNTENNFSTFRCWFGGQKDWGQLGKLWFIVPEVPPKLCQPHITKLF